jgi:hypothetical protein
MRNRATDDSLDGLPQRGSLVVELIALLRAAVFAPSWSPTLRVILLVIVAVMLVRWGALPT